MIKVGIISRGDADKPVANLFPNLRGHVGLAFSAPDARVLAACPGRHRRMLLL